MDVDSGRPSSLDDHWRAPARPVDFRPAPEDPGQLPPLGPQRFNVDGRAGIQDPVTGWRRLRASEVSFGIPGRIVMTLIALLVLAWFVFTVSFAFGIVGTIVYGVFFLPRILRDTWRR